MFGELPKAGRFTESPAFMEKWEKLHAVRDDVNKALELARREKRIGKSLEAAVTLSCSDEALFRLLSEQEDLKDILIVSSAHVEKGNEGAFSGEVEGLFVTVGKAEGEKCERCWVYSETVGQDAAHPTLCSRCAEAVR